MHHKDLAQSNSVCEVARETPQIQGQSRIQGIGFQTVEGK